MDTLLSSVCSFVSSGSAVGSSLLLQPTTNKKLTMIKKYLINSYPLPIVYPSFLKNPNTPVVWTIFVKAFGSTDRKSTRLNSSHVAISYAVFCLKKKIVRIHIIELFYVLY